MTIEAGGQLTASTRLTDVAGDASANVKGSWVELIASTSNDNEWITVTLGLSSTSYTKIGCLVDIGVGAASSESVVISNIAFVTPGDGSLGPYSLTLPLTIPSGSRVSARTQCSAGSRDLGVGVHLGTEAAFGTSSSNITLGADTSASVGTVVDPGGSANTKGAWSQLVASTSADIDYLVVCIGTVANPTVGVDASFLVDIATGAASSESVIIPNISFGTDNLEVNSQRHIVFLQNIPSGTRVAARSQSTETDATDRLLDVSIIGCNMTAPSSGGTPKQAGRGGGMAG